MNDTTKQSVAEYVYKKYPRFQNTPLIITETKQCFHISNHKDSSPLVLSKDVI